MRSLRDNTHAVVDLGVVLLIGIAFAALMVVGYIIWTLKDQLSSGSFAADQLGNWTNTSKNVTGGFDDAINLILVAITVFILAIAISALLMLRGR